MTTPAADRPDRSGPDGTAPGSQPAHRDERTPEPGTVELSAVDPVRAQPMRSEPMRTESVDAEPPQVGPRSGWDAEDDTGPLPPAGTRPGPPPVRPSDAAGEEPVAAAPTGDEPGEGRTAGEQPATPPRTGRAGRDLGAAIGVGLSLGAVIVASLFVWRPAFLVVLAGAVVIGVLELSKALEAGGFRPPVVPVVVGALAMTGLAFTRGPAGLALAFLLTVLAVLLWRLGHGPHGYLRDVSAGVLVALYVPLLAGFAALLLVPDDGGARVLIFIATVVCSDVGGYAAGVLFGKHPMAPSISPKKSWEGLAGSVIACMIVAALVLVFAFHRPWWTGVAFGAAIAASATIGDLGESLIKRDLGIKDMGKLLPGHGGIMDRLDSLLPSAVVAYLLLSALAPA